MKIYVDIKLQIYNIDVYGFVGDVDVNAEDLKKKDFIKWFFFNLQLFIYNFMFCFVVFFRFVTFFFIWCLFFVYPVFS